MKANNKRMSQISDMIARNLSMMLVDKGFVRDPRLTNITITEVEVSRDVGKARVYYIVPTDADVKEIDKSLNKAAGFFRAALSEKLALRIIPKLYFVYDSSIDTAARIQGLIDDAKPSSEDSDESTTDE